MGNFVWAPSAPLFDKGVPRQHQKGGQRLMKPVPISHNEYRSFLRKKLREYYSDFSSISKDTWHVYREFRNLDLSAVDILMQDKYSVFGPAPRPPSCMLRSMLLALKFRITSITAWVKSLQVTPMYAILSGFDPNDVPGVGTFYDFMTRLWDLASNNYSPHIKPVPLKVNKPKGKGKKAAPVEKEHVSDLIQRLSSTSFSLEEEAYQTLFTLFVVCFIFESIKRGVIHPEAIRLAGDGTPIVTSQRLRSHHVCDCAKKGIDNCSCDRYFSQPDCDIGWDSSREKWYFGYDLYLLTDTERDLPLFALLHPASKHDSHSFCETFFRFRTYAPSLKTSQLLLDSAHDSMAMYQFCQREHIQPFIDLNLGNTKKTTDYHGVTIGPDGIPVCNAGLKMKSNGCDLYRQYAKFRCPLASGTTCSCDAPCSSAKYGRTCSIPLQSNIRLYNSPHRGSVAWTSAYNSRTASERCNKRMKIDYLLESAKHRSSKFWYIRTYLIMMLIHLDAWNSITI